MRRFIEREVEDKIANIVIDNGKNGLLGLHLFIENGEIKVNSI